MDNWDRPLISPQLQSYSIPRRGATVESNGGAGLTDLNKKLVQMAGGYMASQDSSQSGGFSPVRAPQRQGSLPSSDAPSVRQFEDSGSAPAGFDSYNSGGFAPPPLPPQRQTFQAGGDYAPPIQHCYEESGVASAGYESSYQSDGFDKSVPPPRFAFQRRGQVPQKRRFEESGVGRTDWTNKFDKPLPEEIMSQCGLFHCGLCESKLGNDLVSMTHYAGKTHEKKVVAALEEYAKRTGQEAPKKRKVELPVDLQMDDGRLAHWQARFQDMYETPLPPVILAMCLPSRCQLCNLPLSSPTVAKSHYEGKNHEKVLKPVLTEYCTQNGLPVPERRGRQQLAGTNRCDICQVDFTSEVMARSHLAGKLHQRRLQKLSSVPKIDESGRFGIGAAFGDGTAAVDTQANNMDSEVEAALKRARAEAETAVDFGGFADLGEGGNQIRSKNGKVVQMFKCEPCNVVCNSSAVLDSHLKGRQHAKKVGKPAGTVAAAAAGSSTAVAGSSTAAAGNGPFTCDLCAVTAPSTEQLEAHFQGQKHKKMMETGGKKPAAVKKPGAVSTFRCELCNIFTTDANLLASHLAGKNHAKKMKSAGQPA